MSDQLQDAISNAQTTLTAQPGMPEITAPAPTGDAWSLYEAKQKRQAEATAASKLGAMWRQDSPVDGIVAHVAGSTIAPDRNYSAFEPKVWAELTDGISDEYHKEFYSATSAAHAGYIRSRLLDKQADLQTLGDLGALGNTGRILFGFVEPSSLLAGVLSGGVTSAVRATTVAGRAVNAARAGKNIAALETATGALADAAKAGSRAPAIAAGVVAAGAFNAGFEKIRQSVNFEDDSAMVLESALIGTALASPFVALNAREMTRLATTADLERRVLGIVRKNHEGTPLDAADVKTVEELGFKQQEVRDIELGNTQPRMVDGPADNMERLYRGHTGELDTAAITPDVERGRWFSTDRDLAEFHKGAGDLWFVDVPKSVADAAVQPDTLFSKTGRLLPPEYAAKSRRLVDAEPSPFLGGSAGSAQINPVGVEPTYRASVRLDIYKTLNTQPNLVIQEVANDLIKDPIGNSKFYAQGRSASEGKSLIRRTLGGYFHRESRDAFNEVRQIRGLGMIDAWNQHGEFYENVSRLVRGDQTVLLANADIAGPLSKAADAMKATYTELAKRAQKSGLEGAENLVPNEHYVNRIWNHNNIRSAISRLDDIYGKGTGRGELDRILAAAVPGFRNDVKKAHSFLNAVRKLEYSHAMQDIQLLAKDMSVLRAELTKNNLTPDEVNSIVDIMFASKKTEADAGRPTNLKYRLDIDESHSEVLKDGSELRIADLFENDSRILVDKYINSMGGHIALAEKGYRSRADFMKRMKDAEDYHGANLLDSADASRHQASMQLLQDMYDNITGRPMSMQSFNKLDRFLGATRAYTRSVFLGQLGVAAAFEMKNAIGLAGVRAFYQQMPSFKGFIDAARSGTLASKDFAADIEHMTGFGLERAASHARQHEVTDFTYDRGLTQFENFTNKASHVVDIISGNAHFTSATRQYSAAMFVQKHYNMAGRKLSDKQVERLVHNGVNADDIDDVFAALKAHTTVDRGVVKEIDWEGWQQKSPDTYDNYVLLVEREVRDAIQDHDIGETMGWMHTTTGKIFSELRTFNLVGHSKQFLKGAHYRDQTTAQTWTIALLGEAMAYTAQTSANYAHDPEQLAKRLTLENIARSSIARLSVLGIAPMLLESGYGVATGGDSLLKGGSTTNTDNRKAWITPSMAVASKVYGGASTLLGAANPLSSNITTKQDVRDLLGAVPGGNTWLMRNINDYVSSGFPKKELSKK